MFSAHVVCHLWDLEDEGIDNVLDRLQGELGVGGVTVVAAGQPICQLRHRPDLRPRIFQSRGGLYFPSDESKYKDTRCKPVVSGWIKSRNPLRKVSQGCHRRDMTLRAVLDTRRIGRVVSRCPSVAAKTVFGDASPGTMCAANPAAVAMYHGLISDLSTNYDVSAIELRHLDRTFETDLVESLEVLASPNAGEDGRGSAADEVARALLTICFCESCLQSACGGNIDADGAMRSVEILLNDALTQVRCLPDSIAEVLAENEILERYVTHRRDEHAALVRTLSQHADCDMVLYVGDDVTADRPPLSAMASECAAINVAVSNASPSPAGSMLTEALEACRVNRLPRCEAVIPVRESLAKDATDLVRTMKQLADLGVAGVHLDHHGMMGEREFVAATQAIRYARRSAVD